MNQSSAKVGSDFSSRQLEVVGFPLKQREIQRAFKAAKNAGSSIAGFEINPQKGTVVFFCAEQGSEPLLKRDEYASWKAGRS